GARGAVVSAAQVHWRTRFEGATARVGLRAIELSREERAVLVETGGPHERSLRLSGGVLAEADLADRAGLQERGPAIVHALVVAGIGDRRTALRRALTRAIVRVERRATAVQGDLAKMATAETLAQRAQLFVAEAARAPRGADRLRAVDWTTGEPVAVELPIDP